MSKLSIEVDLSPSQLVSAIKNLSKAERETILLELNQEVSLEILEAKDRVQQGQTATFEEVFGHPQPQK